MPLNAPYWADFLSCPICSIKFGVREHLPISLGCGHTYCRECLKNLNKRKCPVDESIIPIVSDELPVNFAIIQLIITGDNDGEMLSQIRIDFNSKCQSIQNLNDDDRESYKRVVHLIANMALYLKCSPTKTISPSILSLSVHRKLVALINCQLLLEEGRQRALRTAHSLAERVVNELNLLFQNPQQLSTSLWNAVRARGCQFLGPAMQEEVLKLVLLALEDGSSLSRKVLVMFVVQRLEPYFPQASKTSIGHVVQLLYRASCFRVSKRNGDSSLMQLKENFCTYNDLRREHDSQIVQIAIESGIRIAPEQWSLLLYGDTAHKSHMQSIIRKLQVPSSTFAQSVQELLFALKRDNENSNLNDLYLHLNNLVEVVPSAESNKPTWEIIVKVIEATNKVIKKLVEYISGNGSRKPHESIQTVRNSATKYKISFCNNLSARGICPRGNNCTFAHSVDELEKYRTKGRRQPKTRIKNVSESISQNFVDNHMCHNACQDCESSSVTSLSLSTKKLNNRNGQKFKKDIKNTSPCTQLTASHAKDAIKRLEGERSIRHLGPDILNANTDSHPLFQSFSIENSEHNSHKAPVLSMSTSRTNAIFPPNCSYHNQGELPSNDSMQNEQLQTNPNVQQYQWNEWMLQDYERYPKFLNSAKPTELQWEEKFLSDENFRYKEFARSDFVIDTDSDRYESNLTSTENKFGPIRPVVREFKELTVNEIQKNYCDGDIKKPNLKFENIEYSAFPKNEESGHFFMNFESFKRSKLLSNNAPHLTEETVNPKYFEKT